MNQIQDDLKFLNLPNLLTLIRIGFVPLILLLLHLDRPGYDIASGIIFAIASITDYFDGYLARIYKSETIYGKLLDPLADKFLVITSVIFLQERGKINALLVIILVCRELAITGLRSLASAEGVILAASTLAKWKTATQMVGIPLIMAGNNLFGLPLGLPGLILLNISVGLSLWSAVQYWNHFFRDLKETRFLRSKSEH